MGKFAFFYLLTLPLFALEPIKPNEGSPGWISEDPFITQAGQTTFTIHLPTGWGLGEVSTQEEGGYFALFPAPSGFGCVLEVERFDAVEDAQEELDRLKNSFSKTQALLSGFETVTSHFAYACQLQGHFLIEIWYALPPQVVLDPATWDHLKHCLNVTESSHTFFQSWAPVQEIPGEGWVCSHPQEPLHVLFEKDLAYPSFPNETPQRTYLLQISDRNHTGFFYLKWRDAEEIDSFAPFAEHLQEMAEDVFQQEKNQQFHEELHYQAEEGWAFVQGTPYSLLTLSGDRFLVGLALKNQIDDSLPDFDALLQRISWWIDEEDTVN